MVSRLNPSPLLSNSCPGRRFEVEGVPGFIVLPTDVLPQHCPGQDRQGADWPGRPGSPAGARGPCRFLTGLSTGVRSRTGNWTRVQGPLPPHSSSSKSFLAILAPWPFPVLFRTSSSVATHLTDGVRYSVESPRSSPCKTARIHGFR